MYVNSKNISLSKKNQMKNAVISFINEMRRDLSLIYFHLNFHISASDTILI